MGIAIILRMDNVLDRLLDRGGDLEIHLGNERRKNVRSHRPFRVAPRPQVAFGKRNAAGGSPGSREREFGV